MQRENGTVDETLWYSATYFFFAIKSHSRKMPFDGIAKYNIMICVLLLRIVIFHVLFTTTYIS